MMLMWCHCNDNSNYLHLHIIYITYKSKPSQYKFDQSNEFPWNINFTGLMVDYDIANTIVLEIP